MSFCPSNPPSGRTEQLGSPLDGFSWNLTFEYFSKVCPGNSSFMKIWQSDNQYTCTVISCSVFLRKRNVSGKRYRENQNTDFIFNNVLFRKSCPVRDKVQKCCRDEEAISDNIPRRMRFAFLITNVTDTQTLGISKTYCFSTATTDARMHLNVSLHVNILSCVLLTTGWSFYKPQAGMHGWLIGDHRCRGCCWNHFEAMGPKNMRQFWKCVFHRPQVLRKYNCTRNIGAFCNLS